MRRFFCCFFIGLLLCQIGFAETFVESGIPQIQAKGAVLIERTSGRILYEQNANERLPMASTTKIMTALLAIENSSMDETVVASSRASGVPGTSIYLREGEALSMRNMLYGLMLRSGNDAAVAIAEHIDGSAAAFAERMDRRAQLLDADAHFVTPNGLDADGHGASALGMARIAAAALSYPVFREIVGTSSATIPWPGNSYGRALENKNRLLRTLPGATGVKTGFTSKAGRCLVFSCERDGMELVGAVFNCGSWFDSATELIEWGFANYRALHVCEAGEEAMRSPVSGGAQRQLSVRYAKSITLPLAQEETPMVLIEMLPLRAPIQKGDIVGRATVTASGKTETTVDLLAGNAVDQAGFLSALKHAARNWPLLSTARSS